MQHTPAEMRHFILKGSRPDEDFLMQILIYFAPLSVSPQLHSCSNKTISGHFLHQSLMVLFTSDKKTDGINWLLSTFIEVSDYILELQFFGRFGLLFTSF